MLQYANRISISGTALYSSTTYIKCKLSIRSILVRVAGHISCPWLADNQSRDLNNDIWLVVYLFRVGRGPCISCRSWIALLIVVLPLICRTLGRERAVSHTTHHTFFQPLDSRQKSIMCIYCCSVDDCRKDLCSFCYLSVIRSCTRAYFIPQQSTVTFI